MDGRTHLVAGVLTGIGAGTLCNKLGIQDVNISLIAGSVLGSLLPDTDIENSMLGRFIPIWLFVEHRTITHSIFFIIIICILGFVLKLNIFLIVGLIAGIGSHLLLDSITPMGLPYLLYPFYRR